MRYIPLPTNVLTLSLCVLVLLGAAACEQRTEVEPAFGYTNFAVAPYYGPLYPGLTAYEEHFYFDVLYYDQYSAY